MDTRDAVTRQVARLFGCDPWDFAVTPEDLSAYGAGAVITVRQFSTGEERSYSVHSWYCDMVDDFAAGRFGGCRAAVAAPEVCEQCCVYGGLPDGRVPRRAFL